MKILASIDQSPYGDKVIDFVIRIANDQSTVLLVHVAPREADVLGQQLKRKVITDLVPEELQDRRALMDRHCATLEHSGIQTEALLIRGEPAPTVIDEAERWGAELIVMGSHGRGKLYKKLMGSVSEAVLKSRRFPVLLIPSPNKN